MLTRRDFIAELAAASAAIAAVSVAPAAMRAALPGVRPAVVSFHMDRPYLDATGRAMPYHPPAGARSGDSAGLFSEAQFRALHIHI